MDIYTTIDSPLGEILLAGDGTALTRVSFDVAASGAGARSGRGREPDASADERVRGGREPVASAERRVTRKREPFASAEERVGWRREPVAFAEAERQLGEYFAGERTSFDLPLGPRGTAFQERVWAELAELPYGTTISYGALAARVGAPADRIRAVGAAVGANPLLVLLPCHRVVAADGALTGYAGGLERKRALLTLEGVLQPQLWSTL
ncbi:methylated-DNA--[protein]-cysteine S-methyltransferase [Nonomuraea sp. NPDC050202]|uniref:methylated-DNA--[protein]-cysteine S-methyltransferase n=1 Tax=Nonomuraea sp. NPDC050202 TaxID=3155035 RepID=UPI0033DD2232